MNNGKEARKGFISVIKTEMCECTWPTFQVITRQRLQPSPPPGAQWSRSNCKRHMGTREAWSHLYADLLFEPTFQAWMGYQRRDC